MSQTLLWLYIANAALLAVHEMDSAYWKEWEMFRLPGGVGFFLLLHLPLLGAVFWGLAALARGQAAGLWFSLGLAGAGVLAFCLHGGFLLAGRREFRTPVSLFILAATLLVSLGQAWLALAALGVWPR